MAARKGEHFYIVDSYCRHVLFLFLINTSLTEYQELKAVARSLAPYGCGRKRDWGITCPPGRVPPKPPQRGCRPLEPCFFRSLLYWKVVGLTLLSGGINAYL